MMSIVRGMIMWSTIHTAWFKWEACLKVSTLQEKLKAKTGEVREKSHEVARLKHNLEENSRTEDQYKRLVQESEARNDKLRQGSGKILIQWAKSWPTALIVPF